MVNHLAHTINIPLQSLIQLAHFTAEGHSDHNEKTWDNNSPLTCCDCLPWRLIR